MLHIGYILSGGPDSACAAWECHNAVKERQDNFTEVAFHFSYGQLAVPERYCAMRQAAHLGIPLECITIPKNILTSTITSEGVARAAPGIESSFVPGRNGLFVWIAAGMLYNKNASLQIVGGWNAADYAGYPDCRPEFFEALTYALWKGLDTNVQIQGPVLHLTKAEIIKKCVELNVPLDLTWSCYTPQYESPTTWRPCGQCVSCQFREKGFREANLKDPLSRITLGAITEPHETFYE